MKKYMKYIFSMALCLSLLFSIMNGSAYAFNTNSPSLPSSTEKSNNDPAIQERYMPADYFWGVLEKTRLGTTTLNSGRTLIGEHSATRAGETYAVNWSYSSTVKIEGTLTISAAVFQGTFGMTLEKAYSFGASATSSPLAANETVKAYGQPNYEIFEIVQAEYKIDQTGKTSPTGKTQICTVYCPIIPLITFAYS